MKDSVSLLSQKSKVAYITDFRFFCMSQLELVLRCPSGSLEHFVARAFVRVWVLSLQCRTRHNMNSF